MTTSHYNVDFYRDIQVTARDSAREIVPAVKELVNPDNVIDVGCGTGIWLAVFKEHGVTEIIGLDGDYVDRAMLEIPESCFQASDLTKPFTIDRTFDLAVSLEVAEHLSQEHAADFVNQLTSLSDFVLFSAAIPDQGGTYHINEQWPDYWAALFKTNGFVPLDCLRNEFWENPKVAWWYAQNMLLFVSADRLDQDEKLRRLVSFDGTPHALVHPKKYNEALWEGTFWRALAEIREVVSGGTDLILIDQGSFIGYTQHDPHIIPFPQQGGKFSGLPPNGHVAVKELMALEVSGPEYVVILWPAFWWQEHYGELASHFEKHYSLIRETERIKLLHRQS